ncbi:DNA (cytosine-5-)-methyltransferase [Mannheimia sp. HC-2023]|uniref:DNA cytosine methyltransferase n=1 Tax=Mannheimia indoligenes TaxID=3103145 RepID=UPI002FE6C1FF
MKKLKVASFFCGCGGSDLGIIGDFNYLDKHYSALPFEITYALDFDKFAVQTYNQNFQHPAICGDVKDVDADSLDDFDLLLGGFPCQSFSTVNPTKNTNDERANLYKELVKILKAKQPKFFICENVKGLMSLQKGEILKKVITEFEATGYKVKYKLLLGSNFGIPQKRERLFIIGIRKDLDIEFEFPKETHSEVPNQYTDKWVPLKSVISELKIENSKYYFSEKAVLGMKNAKNNMKRGLWQDLNGQCLTITSHLSKASLNSRDPVLLVDPEKELYRRFTPREAASIQSFPDSFQFPVSDIQAYKQIGNAIPPVLMWHIANTLGKKLNLLDLC